MVSDSQGTQILCYEQIVPKDDAKQEKLQYYWRKVLIVKNVR